MSPTRHYSGILVSAEPGRLVAMLEALAGVEGAQLHQIDEPNARCVVVLESDDRAGLERLFRALQALPDVRGVDLTHHWIDAEPADDGSREEIA